MKNLFDEIGLWGTLIVLLLIVSGFLFWVHIWTSSTCSFSNNISILTTGNISPTSKEIILFVLLTLITTLAFQEVRFSMNELTRKEEKRAAIIAVIVGLMFTLFLFWQPILERIFENISTNQVLKYFLFGGSAVAGWFVWWLKKIEKYGDFFYILLLTTTGGFCWYARIKGTTEVEITAYAFLTSSLIHIAFQYLGKDPKIENPLVVKKK